MQNNAACSVKHICFVYHVQYSLCNELSCLIHTRHVDSNCLSVLLGLEIDHCIDIMSLLAIVDMYWTVTSIKVV